MRFGEKKMENTQLLQKRKRFQKVMLETFQQEFQPIDNNLQSILIDDMITAFYNRLNILKKIQHMQ